MKQQPIIFLVGATATGKTGLSVELAKKFPIEIINADSLQVFRHLDIGTAKPSKEIQAQVPHHLIDILNPDEEFTAKQFKDLAEEKIRDIQSRNKIPMLVGGSGFYLKAFSSPTSDLPAGTREFNDAKLAHQELSQKDPKAAEKIHANDHYRISRALFLLDQNILPSQAFEKNKDATTPYNILWLGISCDRTILRDRIEKRIHDMFDQGILKETEHVIRDFPNSRARLERTIGYNESLQLLDQKLTLNKAMELATTHTRQYAKRQDTWFRKNPDIIWSDLDPALDTFSFSIEQLNQS